MNKIMDIKNTLINFEKRFYDTYDISIFVLIGLIISVVCLVNGVFSFDLKEVAIGYLLFMVVSQEYEYENYDEDKDETK